MREMVKVAGLTNDPPIVAHYLASIVVANLMAALEAVPTQELHRARIESGRRFRRSPHRTRIAKSSWVKRRGLPLRRVDAS